VQGSAPAAASQLLRAVQQLWAQAAASLVGRSGSMEAGKLPGTAQQ